MFISTQNYTQEGVYRLSQVVQATLRYNRWSDRELARQAGISHGTANRYAKGRVTLPQDEIIQALAPHIYKVISISPDGCQIDEKQTYRDNWVELANIALKEWKPSPQTKNMKKLKDMIHDAMKIHGIVQEQLELDLQKMQANNLTDLSVERLRELQAGLGAVPTREERRTLYMLLDTEGRAFPDYEWFEDTPVTNNPATDELRENNNHFQQQY